MWLGLRENEVRALRDIRASEMERQLKLKEVQRNENRVRDLGFAISEIYIGRYFSNSILSLNGSGWVPKSRPDSNPLRVFCFKPILDPIFNRTK